VVIVVGAIVLGVGGTALALGQPSRPTLALTSAPVAGDPAPPTTVPPNGASGSTGVPKTARSGHGTTTVVTRRGSVSVTFDRGIVAGLTYGAVTVAHPDGSTVTLSITAATKFRPPGRHAQVGDLVIVYSAGGTALTVVTR
jgi:hypothetical protein